MMLDTIKDIASRLAQIHPAVRIYIEWAIVAAILLGLQLIVMAIAIVTQMPSGGDLPVWLRPGAALATAAIFVGIRFVGTLKR